MSLALLAVLAGPGAAMAEDTLWTRVLSLGPSTSAASVRALGTNLFLAGTVLDTAARRSNAFAASYSEDGTLLWTGIIDLDERDMTRAVAVGPDQSPYVGVMHGDPMEPVAVLVKLDPAGETLWTRSRPNTTLRALAADPSNGCYMLGTTGATLPGDSLWLARYDATGNLTLTTTMKLAPSHGTVGLCRTTDGTLIAAVSLADPGERSATLVKFSAAGDTLWVRQYPDTIATFFFSVAAGAANTWYTVAAAVTGTRLIKFAPDGDTTWVVELPQGTQIADLATDDDDNCFVVYADAGMDYRIDKYGPDGSFLGSGRSGTPFNDMPASATVGADGFPVVTGMTSDTLGSAKAYTVKFSGVTGGISGPPARSPVAGSKLRVEPNPVTGGLAALRLEGLGHNPESKEDPGYVPRLTVQIYDVSGRSVFRESADCSLQSAMPLDLRALSSGVYLIQIQEPTGTHSARFILVD